jgi:hypothetical protein
VRGWCDNLVIDHNLVISPENVLEPGNVFIGARFKSKPGELWLLSEDKGWLKINSDADLENAQYAQFDQLQLVIPVSVFYDPTDISAAIGEGEIWAGYGLRGEAGTSRESFKDMAESGRYSLVWQAPNSLSDAPKSGAISSSAILCFNTSEVMRISDQILTDTNDFRVGLPMGKTVPAPSLSPDEVTVGIPPGETIPGTPVNRDEITVGLPIGSIIEAPPLESK